MGRSERISLPTHGKKERIDKECGKFFLSDFILFASKFSLPFVCVCMLLLQFDVSTRFHLPPACRSGAIRLRYVSWRSAIVQYIHDRIPSAH